MTTRFQVLMSIVCGAIGIGALAWLLAAEIAVERMEPPALPVSYEQPIDRVDTLRHPIAVKGWDERGLLLAGGSVLRLPGVKRLPKLSQALTEALQRGVEVDESGRVFGLVRVWHWCGNDPVRKHIARVDISRLLIFLGEGKVIQVKPPPCVTPCEPTGRGFTEHGWEVSGFGAFTEWNEALDSPLGRQAI